MKTSKQIKKAFEIQPKYHYYQDSVYSMGSYFKGINLRQIKRFFDALKDISFAYEYMFRYSTQVEITEQEKECLSDLRKCAITVYSIFDIFGEIKEDDRENRNLMYYIHDYDRWIRPISSLENPTKVLKLNKDYSKTEYTLDEYKKFYNTGFTQAINGVLFWGHWIDWVILSIVENDIDLDIDYDLATLVDLKSDIIKVIEKINKLPNIKL